MLAASAILPEEKKSSLSITLCKFVYSTRILLKTIMSVVIETTIGDLTVDLYLKERPNTCLNFLKLCKIKYYNLCIFNKVERNFIAQTGDPTSTGRGGESVFSRIYGDQATYFEAELKPRIKHEKLGTLSMVNNGNNMNGSQFFFTLGENLTYLDEVHTVFGEIVEGFETLLKINESICDPNNRPYQDIRITHTVVLHDPYDDPTGLELVDASPIPSKEQLESNYIGADEEIDDTKGKNAEEIEEKIKESEAKARATILEMVGDIPDADVKPPENVLFVCKLNPVTTSEDLEIIFSRFGPIVSCEVIKDKKSGESLQYAFIEFKKEEDCENAYFKMDNVLIDDRRIHVDFSQSVSKLMLDNMKDKSFRGKYTKSQKFIIKDHEKKSDGYDMVFDMNDSLANSKQKMIKNDPKHGRHNCPEKYSTSNWGRHSLSRNECESSKDIQRYSGRKSRNHYKQSNSNTKHFSNSFSRSPSPTRSSKKFNKHTKSHKIARNYDSSDEMNCSEKVSSKISTKTHSRNSRHSSSSVSPSLTRQKSSKKKDYFRSKHYSSSPENNRHQIIERHISSYKDTTSKKFRYLKSRNNPRQDSSHTKSCTPESSGSQTYKSKHDFACTRSKSPRKHKKWRCHSPKSQPDKSRCTRTKEVSKSLQYISSSSNSSSPEKKQSNSKLGRESDEHSYSNGEKSPENNSQKKFLKNANLKNWNIKKKIKSYNSSDSEMDVKKAKSKEKMYKTSTKTHKHSRYPYN